MERKNFQPTSAQQDERLIDRTQKSFAAGGFDDVPGNRIPANGFKFSKNYIAKKDGTLVVRGGSQRWSETLIPVLRTGYTLTKTGYNVTKTVGTNWAAADAGRWIIYDNGQVDYIKSVTSTTIVVVASNDSRSDSTAAQVRDSIWGWHKHEAKSKIILHIGTYFYVTDANTIAWTRVYGDNHYSPAGSATTFVTFKDTVLAYNANGVFRIDLSGSTALFYRINTPIPTNRVAGNSRTNLLTHCYRYIYTNVRLSGTSITRTRRTSGVNIESESGPVQAGLDYRDYGEIWTQKPIGPSSALDAYDPLDVTAKTYQILTGAVMNGSWDTIAEWAAITDGQFNITIDSTGANVVCDFSSVDTWNDIAKVIQDALRDYFSDATCVWSTDHFIIASPHNGGTVTVTTAGDAGTTTLGSVGLSCQAASGVVTTYDMEAPKTLATFTDGDFRRPYNASDVSDGQWTHYGVYRTLDIGVSGKDPNTGEGNDTETYVWVSDIPIARGFLAGVFTRALTVGSLETATNMITEQDVGSLVYVYDVTNSAWRECYIASYTNRTNCVLTMPNVGQTILTGFPCSYGATRHTDEPATTQTAMNASRAATGVVTRTAGATFTTADVGRRLYWADGTYDRIITYTDANNVVVDASTIKTAQGACSAPYLRSFTDNVSDDTLRNRVAGMLINNRTWEPLPTDSSCGAMKNGFLVTAPRDGTLISYGQIADNLEYLNGYQDPYNQVASVQDKIRHMITLGDYLVVFCSHSIVSFPLNTYTSKIIDKIAMVSIIIAAQLEVTNEVGCYDYGSIKILGNKTQAIFRANDQSIRMISAGPTGLEISGNLAQDRIQKNHLNKLTGLSSNSYDKVNGYIINGSNVKI